MSLAIVFPGQGSQKVGMGETLFDNYPELTTNASTILGYDIKKLCLEDPRRKPIFYPIHTTRTFTW